MYNRVVHYSHSEFQQREVTIATWLKKMGWTVEVKDTRDDEADEEEE